MGSSIIVIIVKPFSFKDRDTPEPLLPPVAWVRPANAVPRIGWPFYLITMDRFRALIGGPSAVSDDTSEGEQPSVVVGMSDVKRSTALTTTINRECRNQE